MDDYNNRNNFHASGGCLFDVKHLATFTVGSKSTLRPEDGMKKLRQMEKSIGIWAMDCQLAVDKDQLVIIDRKTGQEIESVSLNLIYEPTSVVIDDKKHLYNNLFLFTVLKDSKTRNTPTEMHVFHSIRNPSSDIVDEIVSAKDSIRSNDNKRYMTNSNSNNNTNNSNFRQNLNNSVTSSSKHDNRKNAGDLSLAYYDKPKSQPSQRQLPQYSLHSNQTNNYIPMSSSLDEDVRILNHCFDDIEYFVSRLLNVSAYTKEMERRQKKHKLRKRQLTAADMGMLSVRAKLPSQQSFFDIFQKFKLSFNLLAHLKAHIHDPNAPELVHFLFKPLTFIITSTKDSQHLRGISKTVWSPLITREAKELLLNCLTSKEQDLWQSLGEAWYVSKEEARVMHNLMSIEPYSPIFYDGWSPNCESNDTRSEISRVAVLAAQQQAAVLQAQAQQTPPHSQRKVTQRRLFSQPPSTNREQFSHDRSNSAGVNINQLSEEVKSWVIGVQQSGGKVYEVLHDRRANNEKELTLKAGELVEILDDRRNWWRLRNIYGQVGHAPNTILQPFISINLNNYTQYNLEKVGYF